MIGHNMRDSEDVTVEEPTRANGSLFIASAETSPVRSGGPDILHRLLADMGSVDAGLLDHGRRTAQYSVALGHALHLSETDLVHLYCAGLLHDIGKLTLPRDLLRQETPFSPEDYAVMQCHPRSGAEMLAGIPCLRMAALWIAHHHERWDGTGYPYGLRDFLIPLGSRILAVADLFDELAFSTEYPKRPSVAMALLSRAAGSQLDPLLVERFVAILNDVGSADAQNGLERCGRAGGAACSCGRGMSPPVPCPFTIKES